MIAAEFLTARLGQAVEEARGRRNAVIGNGGYGDDVDAAFRAASLVLERFLSGQGSHETSEAMLVGMFDRIGRTTPPTAVQRSAEHSPAYLPPGFR